MYVDAPRSPGGLVTTYRTLRARYDTGLATMWRNTMAEAIDDCNTTNVSVPGVAPSASAQRGGPLTDGWKPGPGRFMDTPYWAIYRSYSASGRHNIVDRRSSDGKYRGVSYPIGLDYIGFHGSGHEEHLGDISPWGSNSTVAAIYNRAVIANMQTQARTQLLNKMADTNFDAAEALTGLIPSVKLVSESVITLVRAYIAVRKGNIKKAAELLNLRWSSRWQKPVYNDIWLEFYYGWIPLVRDIFDGTEEIIRLLNKKKRHKIRTATRRLRTQLMVSKDVGPTLWTSLEVNSSGYATVESKLRFRIRDDFVAYMTALRLNNPLYIAWTALPYSFVVDWISPVGEFLAALNAPIGMEFHGGYQTTRSYGTLSLIGKRRPPSPAYTTVYRSGEASAGAEAMFMQRVVFNTWPQAGLFVKLPLNSYERVASAMSLIASSKKYR